MEITAKFPPVVSAFMQSDARIRHIMGPFRSGKSSGSVVEVVRRAMMQKRGPDGYRRSRWMVVRQTMPQLRDTTIKTWLSWFPDGSIGYWRETGKTYHIKCDDVIAEVMFRALDDAADVKNLLSLEVTGAYLNEVREISREIIEGVDGRIEQYPARKDGGCTWGGIWADTNPPEEGSYVYAMYEQKDPDDTRTAKPNNWQLFKQPPAVIKQLDGSYITNPIAENLENLPAGYYENLVRDKSDDFIRVNALAQYGRSKGGRPVHPEFNRDLHISQSPLIPNKHLVLLVSADFGLTPAMTLKQQDAFGRVLTLDEVVCFNMGLERAVEDKLVPLLRKKYEGYEVIATGDPAGEQRAQSDETSCYDILCYYKKRKYLHKVKLARTNATFDRRGATDHFLTNKVRPAYIVDAQGCPITVEALSGKFMFKKHKDGRHAEEVEKNDWSHIGEACEYGDLWFKDGGRNKAENVQALNDYDTALRSQLGTSGNYYNSQR